MPPRSFVRMELIGAKDLERALLALPERLGKSTLDRALMRAGYPIAQDAEQRVDSRGTKEKITVSRQLSKRQRRQAKARAPGERVVYIGVRPSPVAHLIEFGTGPRYTKRGAYRGQMKATPFMRPAWDAGKHGALDDLGRILGQEIEKSAKRLAKRQAKARR